MVGGIAEIRWIHNDGFTGLGSECSTYAADFYRGLPPIPSISTLLAADPCRRVSIVPGQFASRRGDHQRSLSPTNRIWQRAESFAPNRSNVPQQRKTVENLPFRPNFRSREYRYHIFLLLYFKISHSTFIPNYVSTIRLDSSRVFFVIRWIRCNCSLFSFFFRHSKLRG